MKTYLAQLPPLGWVILLLPVLLVARSVLSVVATEVAHATVSTAVCNLLRLL
jgi:hypothetical protein